MPLASEQILRFLKSVHPYDALAEPDQAALVALFEVRAYAAGAPVYALGARLPGLFIVYDGAVEITDENNVVVSRLGLRNQFGERGLLRDGLAATAARTETAATLLLLPGEAFHKLMADHVALARFYNRSRGPRPRGSDLATSRVETLMVSGPITLCARHQRAGRRPHAARTPQARCARGVFRRSVSPRPGMRSWASSPPAICRAKCWPRASRSTPPSRR